MLDDAGWFEYLWMSQVERIEERKNWFFLYNDQELRDDHPRSSQSMLDDVRIYTAG